MKKYLLGLALLALGIGGHAQATETGPYVVYTIEPLDMGDAGDAPQVPENLYLYPHVIMGNSGSYPPPYLNGVLSSLRSFKPKLYQGTKLIEPEPKDYSFQSLTFMTGVKTVKDFKILMSEMVYTFNSTSFPEIENIALIFHFKNSKLEDKYGGKEFRKKDVPYAVFNFTPPDSYRPKQDKPKDIDIEIK